MPRSLRVLLIENYEEDAILLERELRRCDYAPEIIRVETADGMRRSLDQFEWDVVIADYHLPNFTVDEALAILRARAIDLPFIIVSGAVGDDAVGVALRAGARDFILKGKWTRLGPAIDRELADASNRRERRRAHDALRFLAEASRRLMTSVEVNQVVESISTLVVPFLADWCTVLVHAEPGIAEMVTTAGAIPSLTEPIQQLTRQLVSGAAGASASLAVPTPPSQFIPDLASIVDRAAELALGPKPVERLTALGARSLIAVSLVARQRLVGSLVLVRTGGRARFDGTDRIVSEDFAQRAASAIDNALLYAAEQRARAEAEAALHVRDEFLLVAAHELRTPLTSLSLQAQLAVRRLEHNGTLDHRKQLEAFRAINRQATKTAGLVNQLLEVTQVEAGRLALERRPTDLPLLVEATIGFIADHTADRVIGVHVDRPIVASIDPLRFEQVLKNLVDNAIRFTPEGGRVEVEVRRALPNQVAISVTDNGSGIPVDRRGQLFERFYRAHADTHQSGMGLGLFISRQIVELHGGQIRAEFPPAGGARFVILLPLSADTTPPPS
jgi:signal transduction histidine kinase